MGFCCRITNLNYISHQIRAYHKLYSNTPKTLHNKSGFSFRIVNLPTVPVIIMWPISTNGTIHIVNLLLAYVEIKELKG